MGNLLKQMENTTLPGQPLVEILGKKRVLVENHSGVGGYSQDRIVVDVSYGSVIIQGKDMFLARMSREQLVICGCIESVSLMGKENL